MVLLFARNGGIIMDVREKLVELQLQADIADNISENGTQHREFIADLMIANGVTVQEWISVKDRLPTIYDADADDCVLAIHKSSNKRYYHWRSVANNPFDFTHWMKTPQPPKGE